VPLDIVLSSKPDLLSLMARVARKKSAGRAPSEISTEGNGGEEVKIGTVGSALTPPRRVEPVDGDNLVSDVLNVAIAGLIDWWTKGAWILTWDDLRGALPDKDVIEYQEAPGTQGVLKITLNAGPGIRWWKGIEVQDERWVPRGTAWTADDTTSSTLLVAADDTTGWRIGFQKAKLFGAHTTMYVINDVTSKMGKDITLTWTWDNW
jgi:hypothetical protein